MNSERPDKEGNGDNNKGQGQLRSGPSRIRSFIRFTNLTERSVDVIWLNHEGLGVRYRTLASRHSVDVNTFVGHPWIFRDSVTGDRLCVQLREVYEPIGWNNEQGPPRRRMVYITNQLYSLRDRCLQEVRRLVPPNSIHLLEVPREIGRDLIRNPQDIPVDSLYNQAARSIVAVSEGNQTSPPSDNSSESGTASGSANPKPSSGARSEQNSRDSASPSEAPANSDLLSNPVLRHLVMANNNNNNELAVDRNCNNNNNTNVANQNRTPPAQVANSDQRDGPVQGPSQRAGLPGSVCSSEPDQRCSSSRGDRPSSSSVGASACPPDPHCPGDRNSFDTSLHVNSTTDGIVAESPVCDMTDGAESMNGYTDPEFRPRTSKTSDPRLLKKSPAQSSGQSACVTSPACREDSKDNTDECKVLSPTNSSLNALAAGSDQASAIDSSMVEVGGSPSSEVTSDIRMEDAVRCPVNGQISYMAAADSPFTNVSLSHNQHSATQGNRVSGPAPPSNGVHNCASPGSTEASNSGPSRSRDESFLLPIKKRRQ